jgi:hypothetical protein
MKKLNYLKNTLDFVYYACFFPMLIMLVDYSRILFNHNEILPLNISGLEFTIINTTVKIVIFFTVISALLFLYTISLLRKVIVHFIKSEIFNEEVIQLLNKIGKIMIASTLIKGIPLILYKFIFSNNLAETSHINHFDYHFSGIGLGLFFMVLSEVFKIAKDMKEENELTV